MLIQWPRIENNSETLFNIDFSTSLHQNFPLVPYCSYYAYRKEPVTPREHENLLAAHGPLGPRVLGVR